MAPDDFLPIAEQLGLVMRIDAWVLRTAAAQLESWSEELVDAEHWGVAVNASAPNFADPSYPKRIRSILDDTGLDPSRVTVEVTEHALLANAEIANQVIQDLRAFGIKLAIDDFGTGYSSFSQVASLAFDVLKIDRSLIQRLGDASGGEIVGTVIQMAHSLGLTMVAEGVETEHDLHQVRSLGSDAAQGYFIARPLPPEAISAEFAQLEQAPTVSSG
jgi:EAL domain-containing protein (putative c-di-GMP-specific phosphodiesterase class I)